MYCELMRSTRDADVAKPQMQNMLQLFAPKKLFNTRNELYTEHLPYNHALATHLRIRLHQSFLGLYLQHALEMSSNNPFTTMRMKERFAKMPKHDNLPGSKSAYIKMLQEAKKSLDAPIDKVDENQWRILRRQKATVEEEIARIGATVGQIKVDESDALFAKLGEILTAATA